MFEGKNLGENFANDEPALFAPKTINGSPSSASDVHQFTGSSNGFNGSTPSSATTLSSGPAQCSESGTIGITGLGSCTLPNAYNGFVPSSSHVTIGLPTCIALSF
jgi:hypothetical protein